MHEGEKIDVQRKLGKVSREAGIVRNSIMKKRMEAGEKGTRRQHSGMKSKTWRRSLNREGWRKLLAVGGHAKCT